MIGVVLLFFALSSLLMRNFMRLGVWSSARTFASWPVEFHLMS